MADNKDVMVAQDLLGYGAFGIGVPWTPLSVAIHKSVSVL